MPNDRYIVVNQEFRTEVQPGVGIIDVVVVTFEHTGGTVAQVTIPLDQYIPQLVDEAIMALVTKIEAVAAL